MDRLTERNEYGEAYYRRCYTSPCDGTGEDCDNCNLIDVDVCEALAAYEDTGITPDQMREISRLYQKKCEELIACQRNEHNNGWIPCSERMPEKNGEYIATCHNDIDGLFVQECFYQSEDDEHYTGWDGLVNFDEVIAWQPLPLPYNPRTCAEIECSYNNGTDCPAAAGCVGYVSKGE